MTVTARVLEKGPSTTGVRKFADVFPAVRETCMKYMKASRWYNLEKLEPELAKLMVQQLSIWTRSSFKARGHVYANCPHPGLRMSLLEVIGEEDVVDPRVGMNHRQLLAKSLGRATGQTLEELTAAKPLVTTMVTFNILYAASNRSWEEGIAIASGLERALQESGYFQYEANRLKRDLGWTSEDVSWFEEHAEADIEHGAVIEQLDKYIVDDSKWDMVGETIIEGFIAWWMLFDGLLSAYEQNIPTVKGLSCKGMSLVY